MELPKLGHQCSEESCKQLDFLPLQCSCDKIFCRDHFNSHALKCSVILKNQQTVFQNQTSEFTSYQCSSEGCKVRSLLQMLCEKCKEHYCVIHRHHSKCSDIPQEIIAKMREKFASPVQQFQEAKAVVDKEIDKSIEIAKQKPALSKTANKVQLMRIKSKAIGIKGIPITDRVYFTVEYKSKNGSVENKPVFVSKTWAVGRAIDAIADLCSVPNKNNQSNCPKLRLFKKCNLTILDSLTSVQIMKLLSDEKIVDGDSLILDYVADDNELKPVNKALFEQ